MEQKLFITDIDGTLLRTGQPPHPAVTEAISRFQAQGGQVCLCTGRALPAVTHLLPLLPPCGPGILCGGGMIYDFQQGRCLESHPLDYEIIPTLERILATLPQVSVTVSTADAIYRIRDNSRLLTRGVYEDRTAPRRQLKHVDVPLIKILLTCDEPETLERMRLDYLDPAKTELHRASTHFYELTAAGVNKATAVARLKSLLGCANAFCAGDAPSDLVMAEEATLFFAPETAMDSVKQGAHKIFPAPECGGLAWALDYARTYDLRKETAL